MTFDGSVTFDCSTVFEGSTDFTELSATEDCCIGEVCTELSADVCISFTLLSGIEDITELSITEISDISETSVVSETIEISVVSFTLSCSDILDITEMSLFSVREICWADEVLTTSTALFSLIFANGKAQIHIATVQVKNPAVDMTVAVLSDCGFFRRR